MLKYHLNLVRVCYQNPSIFAPNSIPKTHVKPTSFLDAVLVSKIYENEAKREPKMLDRNCANRPWEHFDHIKPDSWSQGHLHKPSRCSFCPHMDTIWTPFSSSSTCSDIIFRSDFVCQAKRCKTQFFNDVFYKMHVSAPSGELENHLKGR